MKKALILAILWTAFIATSCLLPASAFKKFTFDSLLQLDKLIHLLLYFVLVTLWLLAFKNIDFKKKLLVLLASFFYGLLIEYIQSATHLGRSYELDDVISNTVGCIIGLLCFNGIKKLVPLIKKYLPFIQKEY